MEEGNTGPFFLVARLLPDVRQDRVLAAYHCEAIRLLAERLQRAAALPQLPSLAVDMITGEGGALLADEIVGTELGRLLLLFVLGAHARHCARSGGPSRPRLCIHQCQLLEVFLTAVGRTQLIRIVERELV